MEEASLSSSWAIIFMAILLIAFISWSFTYLLIKFLTKIKILDHPNERSNHKVPIPVGGGIAIIATFALMIWLQNLIAEHYQWSQEAVSVFVFALILALVSFIDDIRGIPRILRLVVQCFAVGICLFFIKDSNPEFLVFQGMLPDVIDTILTFLLWVWFINLFNFMDGVDGISGIQTVSITAGILVIGLIFPETITWELGSFSMLILGASLGFLLWNWQPARIFLGDVGSIPLGFFLGWLLLELAVKGFWIPAIVLPLYYLSDSTSTLIKRLIDGKKFWQAHSEHYYQLAVRSGMNHSRVCSYILFTNIILITIAVISTFQETIIGNIITILIAFLVVAFLLMFLRGRNVN
jgi:UDP-N-acetylmuramyl pentapeptide phosphotransferase/UDP-N-acetylglucosamine-1-phosphate transferase